MTTSDLELSGIQRIEFIPEPLRHVNDAPAIRELDEIHAQAVCARASDIHFEPLPGVGRVRQRVDGLLYHTRTLTAEHFLHVVSRIKLLAGMDIADKRQPQDGRYAFDAPDGRREARCSSMPTVFGEKLVVRLLDHHAQIPPLNELGMSSAFERRFREAIFAPYGFVVVCGPTGSGKTTTLYAAIAQRNDDTANICTIEDPVEVRIPGIAQVQVNPRAGVTFASALRGFVRQDPNFILVGELRDAETANAATAASLGGQLIVTTLHANDCVTAIERLFELGVSRHALAAGLRAIISQRLVRRLCSNCRTASSAGSNEARTLGISAGSRLFNDSGCDKCSFTGFIGRAALFECLFIDDELRSLIASGASCMSIRRYACENGYEPLLQDAAQKLLAGETSLSECSRVLFSERLR